MIKIIDAYEQINNIFENGIFNYAKWESYINSIYPNSAHIFKDEIDDCTSTGEYTFENDFLPHINAVYNNPMLETMHNSFTTVVSNLNERIVNAFGKELNVDIVLYLGLGNAAGWVTKINGNDVVLLGIEKIIELNWCDENFSQILKDFDKELPTMTQFNQCYFGDWCNYCGYGDVGYYLGNKFVHYLLKIYSFDELIGLHIDKVHELYVEWQNTYL